MGILPNTSCEGARTNLLINTQLSDDFASKTESEDEGITCFIIAPGAEIPKWCNHQSVGNYISFWIGRKFPKIALCIALGQNELYQNVTVYFYINGGGNYVYLNGSFEENSSHLWLVPSCHSVLQKHLDDSYPSEQNHVEFVYEIKPDRYHRRHCPSYKPRPQNPTVIKRWGVHVECICCPHKSGISYSPFLSAMSSSVHENSKPPPLLALFPSSSASDMDGGSFNNEGDLGISIETTNIAFDTAWRRDFDPDEFKLTLPPKAIFSPQLQYDETCWCHKTIYKSPGRISVHAGGSFLAPYGSELPLLLHSPTSSRSAMGCGF